MDRRDTSITPGTKRNMRSRASNRKAAKRQWGEKTTAESNTKRGRENKSKIGGITYPARKTHQRLTGPRKRHQQVKTGRESAMAHARGGGPNKGNLASKRADQRAKTEKGAKGRTRKSKTEKKQTGDKKWARTKTIK